VSGIWARKLYDPNDMEKQSKLLVRLQNGSRIKRIRKPERSDVVEALLKRLKQERSDTVPVSGPLLMITFVFHEF